MAIIELSNEAGASVKRAEWGVIASLALSAATALFTGGIVYGQVQAQETRIGKVETRQDITSAQLAAQAVTIARIDANVGFLADEARSRRLGSVPGIR